MPVGLLSSRAQRGVCNSEFLSTLRSLGLRRIASCRLTSNRRVMVSFGGRDLRVHRGYVEAPVEVLRAIVDFVEARSREARARAKRILLGFRIVLNVANGNALAPRGRYCSS